jgi:arsenate reductase-like glutaredoxin family protein
MQSFIEEAGVALDIRDIEKQPLTDAELSGLLGYINLKHFLNPLSESYDKHGLGERMPSREEVLALIKEDHTLLRRPIIRTKRLVTVGCDKKSIHDMLQLGRNGNDKRPQERQFNVKHSKRHASAGAGK